MKDVLPFCKKYIGSKYVFGAIVPKKVANYKGAFDCAEFVTYALAQVLGVFGYGSRSDDAYTGYLAEDAQSKGVIISVEQAARIPGAILLRVPKGKAIGHTAFSQGNGKTIEAHSTKHGVKEDKVDGRRWDYGIVMPGIAYDEQPVVKTSAPAIVYRLKSPMMKAPFVEQLQKALKVKGYYTAEKTDQWYGELAQDAVVRFQRANGLIVDGEVQPGGETTKLLGL